MDYKLELLNKVENEELDKDTVIMAFVKYMSEQSVKEVMESNGFIKEAPREKRHLIINKGKDSHKISVTIKRPGSRTEYNYEGKTITFKKLIKLIEKQDEQFIFRNDKDEIVSQLAGEVCKLSDKITPDTYYICPKSKPHIPAPVLASLQ